MELQDEMDDYLREVEGNLDGIENDLEEFFSDLETRESAVSEEMDMGNSYEWVPRTENSPAQQRAREKYEDWYNAVEILVHEYIPRRHEEFVEGYSKIINYLTLDTGFFDFPPEDPLEWKVEIVDILNGQKSIVRSTPNRIAAEQFRARKEISAQIEKDEITRARQLFNDGLIREGGVIAGVALERLLLTECETSEREINYEPTYSIHRLSQSLYEANVIRDTTMGHLQHLGEIRGDCAHPNTEPKSQDVERLIDDTEQFIREGFEI